MNSKSNRILIIIIICLLAVSYCLHSCFKLDFKPVICIVVGFAFLLLHITKQKEWPLIPSIYLIYWSLVDILKSFNINFENIIPAMFFIAPGIIFLILFFEKKRSFFIVPSSFFIWLGIFIILIGTSYKFNVFSLFFICTGCGFILAYILGRKYYGYFKLYAGVFCIAITFHKFFKFLLPVLFALSGILFIIFIINYIKNKNNPQ